MEAGREMSCDEVMREISDADGRVIRRREIRAHLRACAELPRLPRAIEARRGDFAAIAPLPAGRLGRRCCRASSGGQAAARWRRSAAAPARAARARPFATSAVVKSAATVAVVAAVGVRPPTAAA